MPPSPKTQTPLDSRLPLKRRRVEKAETEYRSNSGDDEGPACQSCRKRKAKCSRQNPCSQCERISVDCIYDERRRPGMKTGAIEALSQRLSMLEHMFLGQGLLLKPLIRRAAAADEDEHEDEDEDARGSSAVVVPPAQQADSLKKHYLRTFARRHGNDTAAHVHVPSALKTPSAGQQLCSRELLPTEEVLECLTEWYFKNVHRWIPILHVHRFRQVMRVLPRSPGVSNILHAITSLCLRFHLPDDANSISSSLRCRHAVILQSMEQFSVENLQALIIIAFDIIASGRGPSAWSVIGSMARTVEQLRLSTEESMGLHSSDSGEFLFRRMSFLRPATSWIEEEERRRVFWTVFTMDRFCSIATGWNNSLTCDDVQRRMPCEGRIWESGNPVETPFFGIAERPWKPQQSLTPTSERRAATEEETDAIGGFAFCIEATETLNLITRFFLGHPISFTDPQKLSLWLIRFKELDLRLVKWRLFLPPNWRNASVLNQDGVMDPNLTLAHVTHNTAVIQLHQSIAFPCAEWRITQVNIPSASSLETCISAACEIGSISQQFLQQNTGVTNPQLSFCLFIAGRVLLVHSQSAAVPLHPSFNTILSALIETAKLWTEGGDAGESISSEENLASRLSKRLVQARDTLQRSGDSASKPTTLDTRQPVYEHVELSRAASLAPNGAGNELRQSSQLLGQAPATEAANQSFPMEPWQESISMAFPALPLSLEHAEEPSAGYPSYAEATVHAYEENSFGGLYGLFDDQYEQVMRVSTYSDHPSANLASL